MGDWEYLVEPGSPSAEDEVLDPGSERGTRLRAVLRRMRVATLLILALLTGTAGWLVSHHHSAHHVTSAAPGPVVEPPFVRPPTPEEVALDMTHQQARDPDPLVDFLRPSTDAGCRLLPIGARSPVQTVTTVVHRFLAGFAVADSSRIIDPNSDLCAVTVRERSANGSVLVISVLPPAQGSARSSTSVTYSRTDNMRTDTATRVVVERTQDGWRIRVGTDGPTSDDILPNALENIADSAALRW